MKDGPQRMRALLELLSSMRFAISLLTVICIASVIGTVLKQHEPVNNYLNQFGPFWFEVFDALDLYAVYSAWWFLLILAFLVLSTSLCILRNTPKIFHDLRQYKENIRAQSLKAFPHKAQAVLAEAAPAAAQRMGQALVRAGWKVKLQQRDTLHGPGWMVAAKSGAANKLGYLAAHTAIVLICLGGLFDGDLVVRAQMWFNDKTPFTGNGLIAQVPEQHRLSDRNPTFRGNLEVTEGTRSGTALLNQRDGVLLQELPFDVELKKFSVDYYSTGMPKLFASDIVLHDRYTGESKEARVEVNHPVSFRGVEIYQSSFSDGGSRLKLKAVPIGGQGAAFDLEGRVGDSLPVQIGPQRMTLEVTDLRVINVENFQNDVAGVDARKVDIRQTLEQHLGAGNKTTTPRQLRNVGPSFTYKLRDAAGQAREFHNYMLPVDMDGKRMMVLGVRDTPAEPFRYLRVPVDEQDGLDGFLRLRAALADEPMRAEAVRRYVRLVTDPQRSDLATALVQSAQRTLAIFAGAEPVQPAPGGDVPKGGLQALSVFIETQVPQAERERAADVLLQLLNGTLVELHQLSRERAHLPAAPRTEATAAFMTQAVLSLSDAFYYPVPMALTLTDFEHVQASVFQVARAPGKNIVYFGCLLLILGVFAMLYVRERRVWVWLAPRADGAVEAQMALSSNRKMLDTDREFATLEQRLLQTPNEVKP